MSKLVLDTSALLALLFAEKGADTVQARGQAGLVSAVSFSEAIAKSLDRNVPFETIKHALNGLRLTIVPFDEARALAAASFRPATRPHDFSFADRACLATAALASTAVLTADQDWTKVDLGIKVHLIRKPG